MNKSHLSLVIGLTTLAVTGLGISQCDAKPAGGAPQSFKLFHVKGRHRCQSQTDIGYTCDVETRNALDCQAGHVSLRLQNCCSSVIVGGRSQAGGTSIGYNPGTCSPLF